MTEEVKPATEDSREIDDAELEKISGGDGTWGAALTVRPIATTTNFGGDEWEKK